MTVSECYRLWQGVPEWKKLASVSRDTAYRTLLKKHGCLEIDGLKRDTLTDLIHKSGRDARDMVQTESVIGHMLKWAQEQGYYHGDVTKTSQVIMIRPKIAVETPPGVKPRKKYKRWYHGTIYTELHNKGKRRNGNNDGNRSSVRFVKGVGMQRKYGYRWVAEIHYKRHRYRLRSYSYSRVRNWLDEMVARFT